MCTSTATESRGAGIELFRRHPHVAVLHTFSKAYGLAGLRIGYAIAPAAVAENQRKIAVPFGVTDLAQVAALASLDAEDELATRIDDVVAQRDRLHAVLTAAGWPAVRSRPTSSGCRPPTAPQGSRACCRRGE